VFNSLTKLKCPIYQTKLSSFGNSNSAASFVKFQNWLFTPPLGGIKGLSQRNGDSQASVWYSVVGRSRGRVKLCVVCIMHNEIRSAGFLVWPQNLGWRFLTVWPQNRWIWVFRFGPQNLSYALVIWISKSLQWFLGLGLKTKQVMIYRLCIKTDRRMKMAWDTHRHLVVCFP
jgi:hypothetical protein